MKFNELKFKIPKDTTALLPEERLTSLIEAFTKLDSNQDGKIELEGYLNFALAKEKARFINKFIAADTDKDGCVGFEEFLATIEPNYPILKRFQEYKGSTDQHAYVQQLREGVPNFFATFIEVLEDREGESIEVEPEATSGDFLSGFLQGTQQALYENHRDSITVTIAQVNPRTVGALIALYERAVGLYASLVNVNAYHQPGVEAGKKAAASVLELQRQVLSTLKSASQPLGLAVLAEQAGAADNVETVYKIVRHLAANQRGIRLEGDRAKPSSLLVSLK